MLYYSSCVTWRLNDKEVIIVVQRMAGRRNQEPNNTPADATNATSSLPKTSKEDKRLGGDFSKSCIVNMPEGTVPWQSVVLGENVAYSREQLALPPPPYDQTQTDMKSNPEYDYIIHGERMKTSSTGV